jgi:hypothetical protein
MNQDGLFFAYKKMFGFLGLNHHRNYGITLIVSPNWMFLGQIEQPYHLEKDLDVPGANLEDGIGIYLDGFAHAGILNLQTQVQKWPETTGISHNAHDALASLNK